MTADKALQNATAPLYGVWATHTDVNDFVGEWLRSSATGYPFYSYDRRVMAMMCQSMNGNTDYLWWRFDVWRVGDDGKPEGK